MIKFIGLDGGQGSGKTTYSRKLILELQQYTASPIIYLETDDFLTERKLREGFSDEFFEVLANRRKLWDFDRLGSVLAQLKTVKGGVLHIDGLYNHQSGQRDQAVSLFCWAFTRRLRPISARS